MVRVLQNYTSSASFGRMFRCLFYAAVVCTIFTNFLNANLLKTQRFWHFRCSDYENLFT
jgi:hypothetical protein